MRINTHATIMLYLAAILLSAKTSYCTSAVTYALTWGRFGDHLVSYCQAQWLAHIHNIPMLYRPFTYSDQLMMHVTDEPFNKDELATRFKGAVFLDYKPFTIHPYADILYIVPLYSESHFEQKHPNCTINWNDPSFVSKIKNVIKPRFTLSTPVIPPGHISVAVHVRRGTGFDVPPLTRTYPFKAPPDSYYIEQIQKIADLYADQQLYVYIFTDHTSPQEIVQQYQSLVNRKNIIFACQQADNKHDATVLEDFFALTHFDCLIRPDSNFSIMASKLTDYKVQISPYHIQEIDGTVIVDQVLKVIAH